MPNAAGASVAWARTHADVRDAQLALARVEARYEQGLIDAEVRETRRAFLRWARRLGGPAGVGFLDEDFLNAADHSTLLRAIVGAAVTVAGAAAADLQLYDRRERVLRLEAQQGFTQEFQAFFGDVPLDAPTACATAFVTGGPVLVDHVIRSGIFTERRTRDAVMEAGTRAVYSYPLPDPGGVDTPIGILSFHHPGPVLRQGRAEFVATAAAAALHLFPTPRQPTRSLHLE